MLPWPAVFRARRFEVVSRIPESAEFDVAGFAGVVGALLVLLLLLARATHSAMSENDTDRRAEEPPNESESALAEARTPFADERRRDGRSGGEPDRDGAAAGRFEDRTHSEVANRDRPGRGSAGRDRSTNRSVDSDDPTATADDRPVGSDATGTRAVGAQQARSPVERLSTGALLVNVAFSHGLFGVVLVGAAIVTAVPPAVLGVHVPTIATVAVGTGLGVGLYVASEIGATVSERAGLGRDETLRELLAPESAAGWVLLLGVVLPIIAGFEELLFRGALVGALAAGFGLSPWLLAILSSIAFGFGHGVQGASGIAVTGLLGFVLAAAFVLTGSLVVVIVAHYAVNALEFVIHEGLGVEWADR